jgi:flagellar M-ring protein FliF
VPLGADEIEKISALVRESIGFNKDRGDSVKVINAPFRIEPSSSTATRETPYWKMPELIDLIRAAALPLGLALVAVLVFFGLVRPAVKSTFSARPVLPGRPGTRIDAVVDDEAAYPPQLAAPSYLRQIEGAKALAKDNPAAVAGIVRGWVGGGEAT